MPMRPPPRPPLRPHPALLTRLAWTALVLAALGTSGTTAGADDPVPAGGAPLAAARKENVERLGRELRKLCTSPRAAKERKDIDSALESLVVLGGVDAVLEMLGALAFDDEATEKKVFDFVETVRDKALVKPLAALVEDKDTRRRFRLHAQIAHAFAAIGDVSALEPLAKLVESEDPRVVAAAADALVAFKSASHAKRLEPVKQLLEVFESTWNLKESRRPEDRIQTEVARQHWEVYGASCREALQALTGQSQFTRPREFRDWWNDNKKATNW